MHEESKQTMEDLLRDLPPGYLEEGDHTLSNSTDLDSTGESQGSSEEKEERLSDKGRIHETSDNKERKESDSVCEPKLGRGIKRKKVKLKSEDSDDAEKDAGDKDFEAEESEEDNEETIEEQEEKEGEVNYEEELEDLQVGSGLLKLFVIRKRKRKKNIPAYSYQDCCIILFI